MYIRELNHESLNTLIKQDETIVLTIYCLNDLLSDLLLATITSVKKNINDTIIVANIEKAELIKFIANNSEYHMPKQLPEIWMIKKGVIISVIPGFSRVGKIVDIIRTNVA